jgi:hypothetical protein
VALRLWVSSAVFCGGFESTGTLEMDPWFCTDRSLRGRRGVLRFGKANEWSRRLADKVAEIGVRNRCGGRRSWRVERRLSICDGVVCDWACWYDGDRGDRFSLDSKDGILSLETSPTSVSNLGRFLVGSGDDVIPSDRLVEVERLPVCIRSRRTRA